jgi:TolA-binding protein
MNRTIKLSLYAASVAGILIFGMLTVGKYRAAMKTSEQRTTQINRAGGEGDKGVEGTNTADMSAKNSTAGGTNVVAVNAVSATNTAVVRAEGQGEGTEVAGGSARAYTRMVSYGLVLLLFAIVLAVLIAYDVSHLLASKAHEALYTEDGQPTDSDYEAADKLCMAGKHLEAVRAMRDYLEKHPREQHVALRIAEIYEENLQNPLAAALEYEEVLKKKIGAERWGWAAIHLANIYSGKLNKPDRAVELLRRIHTEYGQTSAANKARERLAQVDPDFLAITMRVAEAIPAEEPVEPEPTTKKLPPGFRPKS